MSKTQDRVEIASLDGVDLPGGDSNADSTDNLHSKSNGAGVSLWRKLIPKGVTYSTARERRFVWKLDLFLLSWTTVAYFMKSIDQTNVSNAYVSGMKEQLNFHGRQYNWIDTYFKIGYSISLIPSQILMNKTNPQYVLSTFEVIWGVLVALCAVPKSATGLYPLRFFIGFFEASSWPGIIITLMNYYTKEELATRIGIFQCSYYAGNMFSGFMQAAIHKNLDGVHGLFGFQWLFIINGAMTIGVGLLGYVLMCDTPGNGGSRIWMNDDDRAMALERMERAGRQTKRRFKLREFFEVFTDWRLWLFLLAYCPKAWCLAYSYFNLYLKSLKNSDGSALWSVEQLNLIPVGGNAISLFFVFFWSFLADLTQKPGYIVAFQLTIDLFCNIVLEVWPSSLGLKYAAFFMIPISDAVGPLLISLLAEVYTQSPEKRAIATGAAVVIVYAMNAWLVLYLWPADQAPRYEYGYSMSILFIGVSLVSSVAYYLFVYRRSVAENERREIEREIDEDDVDEDGLSVHTVISNKPVKSV